MTDRMVSESGGIVLLKLLERNMQSARSKLVVAESMLCRARLNYGNDPEVIGSYIARVDDKNQKFDTAARLEMIATDIYLTGKAYTFEDAVFLHGEVLRISNECADVASDARKLYGESSAWYSDSDVMLTRYRLLNAYDAEVEAKQARDIAARLVDMMAGTYEVSTEDEDIEEYAD